jgi:hypothetical protein
VPRLVRGAGEAHGTSGSPQARPDLINDTSSSLGPTNVVVDDDTVELRLGGQLVPRAVSSRRSRSGLVPRCPPDEPAHQLVPARWREEDEKGVGPRVRAPGERPAGRSRGGPSRPSGWRARPGRAGCRTSQRRGRRRTRGTRRPRRDGRTRGRRRSGSAPRRPRRDAARGSSSRPRTRHRGSSVRT